MQENRVSIQLPSEDVQKVNDAIKIIQDALNPHMVALSPDDKSAIPKMGDGNIPFVKKALEYASTNNGFVPGFVDMAELKVDIDATEVLTNLLRPLQQLTSTLTDTTMLCGSEAYVAALAFYNSVKQAAKMNVPGAKPIYEDLRARFIGQGRKKDENGENT